MHSRGARGRGLGLGTAAEGAARVRPEKMQLLQWLRRESARRPANRPRERVGECACAGGAACSRGHWHEAEGVARGRRARPRAPHKPPNPLHAGSGRKREVSGMAQRRGRRARSRSRGT